MSLHIRHCQHEISVCHQLTHAGQLSLPKSLRQGGPLNREVGRYHERAPSDSFSSCVCCCCCCWIRLNRSISLARSIQYPAILSIVVRSSGKVSCLARANKSCTLRRQSSASMSTIIGRGILTNG